jgi:hypothetical protein
MTGVYSGKEELTPSYITNMTKAHLKDGATPFALKYFSESIQKLGDIKK